MIKRFLVVCLFSIIIFNCSSDGGNSGSDDDSGPVDVESFLFAINVVGDFFNASSEGKVYASNNLGEIIAQGDLINNSTTSLEAIFDTSEPYDISILIEQPNGSLTHIALKTFRDVSPGTYTLTEKISQNPNGDQIDINLFNTGFPLEIIAPTSSSSSSSAANGGSTDFSTTLRSSPGDFYGSFLSPNDSAPRYLFLENINGNHMSSHDYTLLPFVENESTINYGAIDDLWLSVDGFRDFNNEQVSHSLFSEPYDTPPTSVALYTPNNIFDYFRVSSRIDIGVNEYTIVSYGPVTSQSVTVPSLDYTISSATLANFSMSTSGDYEYYQVRFSDFIGPSTLVSYEIFGEASTSVSIQNDLLFNTIFQDNAEIDAANMINAANHLFKNSSESNFNTTIQNRIEDLFIYPSGTQIMSLSK